MFSKTSLRTSPIQVRVSEQKPSLPRQSQNRRQSQSSYIKATYQWKGPVLIDSVRPQRIYREAGSCRLRGSHVRFKYHYRKNAKCDDELLRAEFVLPHVSINVSWAATPMRHLERGAGWTPQSRVNEATFVYGADVCESTWIYNHRLHPIIVTKLNGHPVEIPVVIRNDWLGLLKKPLCCTFGDDNPFMDFTSMSSGRLTRICNRGSRQVPTSTSRIRSQL